MPADGEVRSGARLARIVEMLAVEHRPLGAGEIASALDIPTTSVQRIMATLVRLRWVQKNAAGAYVLGPRYLGTAGVGIGRSALVQLCKPVLRQVAEISGLQSHLGVLAGRRVTYLARAVGADAQAREFHLGAAQPIHCTAAGKLLFAFLPEAEREELIEDLKLRSYTERTITDRERLRAELEGIRSQGYSRDPGEFSDFWRSMAVPVAGPGGEVIAAITCGERRDRVDPDQQGWVRHEMVVMAEELSQQLA